MLVVLVCGMVKIVHVEDTTCAGRNGLPFGKLDFPVQGTTSGDLPEQLAGMMTERNALH